MPDRPAGCTGDLPCELFPLPACWTLRARIVRHVAWFHARDGTNAREYTTRPEALPRDAFLHGGKRFAAKPEVTGKAGIRFVVVFRVLEGVFFGKEVAS